MTTGRINQVTTDESGGTPKSLPDRQSHRLLNAEPHGFARRSFNDFDTQLASPQQKRLKCQRTHRQPTDVRRPIRQSAAQFVHHRHSQLLGLLFTVRLPNTRCEVGIFKTVEFITKLDAPESIVPNWTLLQQLLAGDASTKCIERLSAGNQQ